MANKNIFPVSAEDFKHCGKRASIPQLLQSPESVQAYILDSQRSIDEDSEYKRALVETLRDEVTTQLMLAESAKAEMCASYDKACDAYSAIARMLPPGTLVGDLARVGAIRAAVCGSDGADATRALELCRYYDVELMAEAAKVEMAKLRAQAQMLLTDYGKWG